MKRIVTFLLLAFLSISLGATDRKMEKEIEKTLSKLTLDQKIGQMIQLEVTQVALYKYDYQSLIQAGPEKVDALIRQYGLQDVYHAETLFRNLTLSDLDTVYPFYTLMLDLSTRNGFQLDPEKMENVFKNHHVGSILNMLGGNEAASLETWQKCMAQLQEASLRYNGLPIIYGIDHVHGPVYVTTGTIFPHQLNMAATFNPALVKELGEMNAYETRAAGVPWDFGPNMDLGVKPTWSRFYETWGEDPYLTTVMAGAYMEGLQGPDPDHIGPYHVAVSLKHYVGYGAPDNGIDRTPATISPADLREKHFEPFRQAALKGAASVMTNSAIVNGVPGVCNRELITVWLKEELDWDGLAVTDWGDVQELVRLFKVTDNVKEAIALAVNAGIDMIMVPSSLEYGPLLKELVEEGTVPMSRIDDAVRRILRLKYRVGLFDKHPEKVDYPLYGSEQFAQKAYQAAVESEVLLKNENGLLPLSKDARILVCGPAAATMRSISGGWTYAHQGNNVERFSDPYNTILEALQQRFPNLIYEPGVEFDLRGKWYEEKTPEIEKAVAAAAEADYIVCCVGESSYAETQGSIYDANLSVNQKELVKALAATGKTVILILAEGRPRIISDIEPLAGAIVDVMLPSNYGGDALAALLCGEENFSGKLPFTYPSHPNSFTTYNYKVMENRSTIPGIYNYSNQTNVQWWFGEGLSYTSFAYAGLRADKEVFGMDDVVNFSVEVTNTGDRAGKETVLLFMADDVASLMPDNRRLRAFTKVELQPGETRRVELSISARDLAFVGHDGRWHLEEGTFTVLCGKQYMNLRCNATSVW